MSERQGIQLVSPATQLTIVRSTGTGYFETPPITIPDIGQALLIGTNESNPDHKEELLLEGSRIRRVAARDVIREDLYELHVTIRGARRNVAVTCRTERDTLKGIAVLEEDAVEENLSRRHKGMLHNWTREGESTPHGLWAPANPGLLSLLRFQFQGSSNRPQR
jgi:hypothetical protein